jgi:hypothetical protein
MKRLVLNKKNVVSNLVVLATAANAAAFSGIGAEVRFLHPVPQGGEETCLVPKHYAANSKLLVNAQEAEDREDELKLCRLTIYEGMAPKLKIESVGSLKFTPPDAKEILACPKYNSTNPGTNLIEVPTNMTYGEAKTLMCVPKDKALAALKAENEELDEKEYEGKYDLDAKFKSTISCSATSSALGYYHVSRLLGGAGRVPVAVARTLSRTSHHEIATRAVNHFSGSDEIIAKNWRAFQNASDAAAAGKPNSKIYTDKGSYVYGSLQKNLKGEERYTEIGGRGAYDDRYTRFLGQDPFLRVANPADVRNVPPGGVQVAPSVRTFSEMAPQIVQMQDVADMVLMDTLMAQDDRIGNIHVKPMVLEIGSRVPRKMKKVEEKTLEAIQKIKKSFPLSAAVAAEASSKVFPDGSAVFVRAMFLKDNDCGVDTDIRGNQMRRNKALESVRHMNPETYKRFMAFAEEVESDRFKTFASETLLYRPVDYQGHRYSLKENVRHAVKILAENCERGLLKLDLVQSFDEKGNWVQPPAVSCR